VSSNDEGDMDAVMANWDKIQIDKTANKTVPVGTELTYYCNSSSCVMPGTHVGMPLKWMWLAPGIFSPLLFLMLRYRNDL
jgi:hypothetical protein